MLVVTGGTAVPEVIMAVDASGTPVGSYTAGSVPSETVSSRASVNFIYGPPPVDVDKGYPAPEENVR
ncbi:hypothetical protein [Nocardia sp. XZ_19_369]|uniref:hypothetical protein n=1 Tax=Nocardia sp. XZ_19_369 TaxID=2769487 RepID=UPI00188E72F5|nr:hypothetical protein [Nocardia sp. XZ_19_369]